MVDPDHLVELKAAADPAGVAAALGLRGRGRRFFCPACQSDGLTHRTPDLAVGDKGFTCHKCGLKGDLLKLVEVTAGLDFPAAVAWLESHTGIRPSARTRGKVPKTGTRPPAGSSGPAAKVCGVGGEKAPTAVSPVYEAFLEGCRPVDGSALQWLTEDKGIAPEVVESCRLRFCGREYADLMEGLKTRFPEADLAGAGLLKKGKSGRLVPSFWHYFAKEAGFLVIPYLSGGRPVYLKARPPCGKEQAERLGLVRFLNTAAAVPCLYNMDALEGRPDRVLVCEGESDTWTALSHGFAAVGSPGARNFKPAWAELFRGFRDDLGRSTVYLVPDADAAGAAGSRIIADLFLTAGLPAPRELRIPSGKDLSEYMKGERMKEGGTA